MIALIFLLSCHPTEPPIPVATPIPLNDLELLRRLSLDIRGVVPTSDEISMLQDNPESLTLLRDEFLEDPRFSDRMVSFWGEQWHTLIDVFDIVYFDYHLSPQEEYIFERSVGEEPLRLLAYVASENKPWSEVVTADYTLSNDLLQELWPLTFVDPDDESEWKPARYTDGRPPVGVIATNGLWWRYTTDESNMNRSRAAAISRLLLCEDILARPVTFSSIELEELISGNTNSATLSNPECLACHSTLDPMATTLFGFWWLSLYSTIEETSYHPEREALGEEYLETQSAYFGEPIDGLADMGHMLANDPRLYTCAVDTIAKGLWRRPVTPEDRPTLHQHWIRFMNGGTEIKELIRSITDGEEYRTGDFDIDPTPAQNKRYRSSAMLPPEILASSVEDITGFRWELNGFDLMLSDDVGYRTLSGGVDGLYVFQPQDQPGLTWALSIKRMTQLAGRHVSENDLNSDRPKLLTLVTQSTRPHQPEFRDQLEEIHFRIFSTPASEDWLSETTEAWDTIDLMVGSEEAWVSIISMSLRDPRFLFY